MMIRTGWHLALRVSELVAIRVQDFTFKAEEPSLYVRDEIAKNGNGGEVPILEDDYYEKLKKYVEDNKLDKYDFLFNHGKDRKPYSKYHIIKLFRQIGERAYAGRISQRKKYGEKKFRSLFNPHMLRHSRARYLLKQKRQIDSVKDFLRHQLAVTTLDTYGNFTKKANIKHLRELPQPNWEL